MYGVPLSSDELEVASLGSRRVPSPLDLPAAVEEGSGSFVPPGTRVRCQVDVPPAGQESGECMADGRPTSFEKAGPRREVFFDPAKTRAAIVTCGGLCPGINNVIRSAYYQLFHRYGVRDVLGIRYGFQGLNPAVGDPPVVLTPQMVEGIHNLGGTVLGTCRGPQPAEAMVDLLVQQGIDILLCIGGDGTQRAVHVLAEEIGRRGLPIAIVGIPKTIDNDIPFVYRSFGFFTALEKAQEVIQGAHVEARGVFHGVGLVKLMGREAGYIAAGATLASQEVNFCLIPEQPFALEGEDGFLAHLERRLVERRHAVVVVAEGAGQHLFPESELELDPSGNVKFRDVGLFLKRRIREHFAARGLPAAVKYFDPSYAIRSVPANTADSLLCDSLARHAVHAAMAGKTDVLVGNWHNVFIHVPVPAVVRRKKLLPPDGGLWTAVLEATGQPRRFGDPAATPRVPAEAAAVG